MQHRGFAYRPGFGNALYTFAVEGELQTTPFCFPNQGCVESPVQFTPLTGTTVAWAATAGTPTKTPGASSKASATVLVVDRDGLHCIGPGVSFTATRTQYQATCLLLDSKDDVPSGRLFP